MSGRHRARHPSAVSSSDGRIRPRVVNSRTISAIRAANRKSAASAMPDCFGCRQSDGVAGHGHQRGEDHRRFRPAEDQTRDRPQGTARMQPTGRTAGRSVGPRATGSRPASSRVRQPEHEFDLARSFAHRSTPAEFGDRQSDAIGIEGERMGPRAGLPGRPPATSRSRSDRRRPSSAHKARRPAGAAQAAWSTITPEWCLAGVTLSRLHPWRSESALSSDRIARRLPLVI